MKIGNSFGIVNSSSVVPPKQSVPVANQQNGNKNEIKEKAVLITALGSLAGILLAVQKRKLPTVFNVNAFKDAGHKFVKGKADTGTIEQIKKDGSKVIMTYEKGVLKSSEIQARKFGYSGVHNEITYKPLLKKQYNYTQNGELSSVEQYKQRFVNNLGYIWDPVPSKTRILVQPDLPKIIYNQAS